MATVSANTIYQCTNQMLGSYSGGTWESSLRNAPHPVATRNDISSTGTTVVDLSAIVIGGFNGLNN